MDPSSDDETQYPDPDESSAFPWHASPPGAKAKHGKRKSKTSVSKSSPRVARQRSQPQRDAAVQEGHLEDAGHFSSGTSGGSSSETSEQEQGNSKNERASKRTRPATGDEHRPRRGRPRGSGRARGSAHRVGRGRGAKALLRDEGLYAADLHDDDEVVNPKVALRGRPKGSKRGIQKPVEPSEEFKALHGQALTAFLDHELEEAEELAKEAILANPEIFVAHSLLSEIYLEQGDKERALSALFNGAHTRPRDPATWTDVAERILTQAEDDQSARIKDAIYCYSRVLAIDSDRHLARLQRARLMRELRSFGKAAPDYVRLIKVYPDDKDLLRELAEVHMEAGKSLTAVTVLEETLEFAADRSEHDGRYDWSDVNIYGDLLLDAKQHEEGLLKLKRACRILQGRQDETYWDDVQDDDREYDAYHHDRRISLASFNPTTHPEVDYGENLPLELRIKFGLMRLRLGSEHLGEALEHFSWLRPDAPSDASLIRDYGDLFKEVGDALFATSDFTDAIRFLEPLASTESLPDEDLLETVASCFVKLNRLDEAEEIYVRLLAIQPKSLSVRKILFNMFTDAGLQERAQPYVRDYLALDREAAAQALKDANRAQDLPDPIGDNDDDYIPAFFKEPAKKAAEVVKKRPRSYQQPDLREDFAMMDKLSAEVDNGDADSRARFLSIAESNLQRFREFRMFFPSDRYNRFFGYSREARAFSLRPKTQQWTAEAEEFLRDRPTTFCEVGFERWLDLFLDCSIVLSHDGQSTEAYEMVNKLLECNVWFNDAEARFRVHVIWAVCALTVRDERTLCAAARALMLQYQFVTDAYRFYAAVNLLSRADQRWYNSSPSQKFILRQIKAVDWCVAALQGGEASITGKASLSTRDDQGRPIRAEELNIGLLMLHAEALSSGGGYGSSLHYYFRALTLDPHHPLINLSLSIGYLHLAVSRHVQNRHATLLQALSFMLVYHDHRIQSSRAIERQEAEYNTGRFFHGIGLLHLAVPYYERVLALSAAVRAEALAPEQSNNASKATFGREARGTAAADNSTENTALTEPGSKSTESPQWDESMMEDFAAEAAYCLQDFYASSGNWEMAQSLAEQWLVI